MSTWSYIHCIDNFPSDSNSVNIMLGALLSWSTQSAPLARPSEVSDCGVQVSCLDDGRFGDLWKVSLWGEIRQNVTTNKTCSHTINSYINLPQIIFHAHNNKFEVNKWTVRTQKHQAERVVKSGKVKNWFSSNTQPNSKSWDKRLPSLKHSDYSRGLSVSSRK